MRRASSPLGKTRRYVKMSLRRDTTGKRRRLTRFSADTSAFHGPPRGLMNINPPPPPHRAIMWKWEKESFPPTRQLVILRASTAIEAAMAHFRSAATSGI